MHGVKKPERITFRVSDSAIVKAATRKGEPHSLNVSSIPNIYSTAAAGACAQEVNRSLPGGRKIISR